MTVFVDTSALFALLDRDDAKHRHAGEIWQSLESQNVVLVTSNYVMLEAISLLQNRLGMDAVRVFQADIVPLLGLEWIDQGRHQSAVEALLAAGRRKLSLVDCVSFQVMRENRIGTAFCFDEHFREQGFEIVG